MKPVQFEEKEYELALYNQLGRNTWRLWPPGQVLESYLGIDLALLLNDPFLWNLRGFARPLKGFSPWHKLWPIFQSKQWQRSRLPRFRCNCFIQAKRPQVGSRLPIKLRSLGTSRLFFVFRSNQTSNSFLRPLRSTSLDAPFSLMQRLYSPGRVSFSGT